MENRKTARTCVMFVVLFVLTVHGGAARPVRSGSDRTLKEQNELQARAPDAAAAGPIGTGGSGVGDQRNFLPLGGVGMGAGMGGYAGMGSYVGGVMPTLGRVSGVGGGFGMGGGFGAGGGAGVGGMGGMGTGPLGGLNGLGVGPGGTGGPLPLP
ncbi:uncharacterized protein LOC115669328 [Syzygium oleosum]|uniref:uncharacterized protein LOC115669328 n=1 Tax=Syzygium oleosum TaxID=219896 RepID=UPI0011D259F0|nr:uncharacterized protein LOC115669328 [Syzygium oleosum]